MRLLNTGETIKVYRNGIVFTIYSGINDVTPTEWLNSMVSNSSKLSYLPYEKKTTKKKTSKKKTPKKKKENHDS